jgi:hypothetical protein
MRPSPIEKMASARTRRAGSCIRVDWRDKIEINLGRKMGNLARGCIQSMSKQATMEIEAAVFRRLLQHFDSRKDVQNIELMILAGFCRNCLSKWYVEAAREQGIDIDLEEARRIVYGMPYSEWKAKHQPEATEEQLARFKAAQQAAD